jgi:lipoate---protein ligase
VSEAPFELPAGASEGWAVEHLAADPGEVHARPLPGDGRRRVTVVRPTAAAVVLGSTQSEGVVRPGQSWVRRRGGGGAVWVEPGVGWFEFFVPTSDELWCADVGRAFWLPGEMCAEVLEPILGHRPDVHRGAVQANRWSSLVCFAGTGPGELFVDGRKLVGLTQRRARAGSRIAGIVYDRWQPEALLDRLALDADDARAARNELYPVGVGMLDLVPLPAAEAAEQLGRQLA